jgi:outer membrane lipase/esterase
MKLKLTSIAIATTALFSSQSFADITSFTRLISLGDSSSDGGTYSNAIRAADPTMPNINYKLTTNFSDGSAKVTVEYLSDKLGTSITNYAQGGAFVASPSAFASPSVGLTAISVKDQIDLMLTQSPTLNSKDIAVFWAGFNNINNAILFTAIPNNLSQSSIQGATAQVTQAANDYATQIIRVKNAGAGLVLINSVSNLGQVPLYVNNFPQASNLAKNLSIDIFNGTLKKNLVGSNILYVDTAKLLNAMIIDPSRFGFTATNASTTSYPGLTYSSLANSTVLGQAIGYTSAANKALANSYLFTDIGHPTDAAHLIYSQLDFSVIQSVGQQASMLVAPSYAVRQTNSDIEPHLSSLALMRGANLNTDTRPLGDNQFWFSGGSNGFDSNSNQITPSFSSHTTTGTIGLDRMIASNAILGGAFSYSNGHS